MGASRAHARAFEACDDAVHAEAEEDAEAAAVECDRVLADLELQVWLELDAFLRRFAWNRGTIIGGAAAPAPVQLLGLLPPPPVGGWPDDFILGSVVVDLRKAAAKRRARTNLGPVYDPAPYVPTHARYPPRRRAQRLSYSIWIVLKEPGLDLQPPLDTASTARGSARVAADSRARCEAGRGLIVSASSGDAARQVRLVWHCHAREPLCNFSVASGRMRHAATCHLPQDRPEDAHVGMPSTRLRMQMKRDP